MIYNNLIYFLVVILILSTNTAPDHPQLSGSTALLVFIGKAALFFFLQKKLFSKKRITSSARYSSAERNGSILAIIFFSLDIYLLDLQYYLVKAPLASTLHSISSLLGLILFMSYLSVMWLHACARYKIMFGSIKTPASFIKTNILTNLPIVLPWLLIGLFADIMKHSPFAFIKTILASSWGEPVIFLIFFFCLALTFPIVITRLWGCTSMPPGENRQRIEDICQKHRIKYADIMLWPLFEGQAITAGVMGIAGRFRYLLVTPALLSAMTPEETEAVMVHEIGHIKKRHLQLYLLLFLGFGTIAQLSSYPILHLLTNSDLFYQMIHLTNKKPGNALALASTIPMFVLMIVYFRYVMGFFMRNFERQADLYALKSMRTSAPLVRVFDKIAMLTGNSRDQPSWHHFGIGQRVDFLIKSDNNPTLIKKHDRKVYTALAFYFATILFAAITLWQMPNQVFDGAPREKFAEAVIMQKMQEEPSNHVWPQLLGDLQYSLKRYHETLVSYRKALELAPENHETLNNLAWLLLTAEDQSVRNPKKALILARQAVIIMPAPHYLDTLALAYWQNGFPEQAILAEKRALAQNPENRAYFLLQLEKYSTQKPNTKAINAEERDNL